MRTLLTGFGHFGRTVRNPSARIVEHFAAAGMPGHLLTARVLPVSFRRAEQEIRALLSSGEFDTALLLGVARGGSRLRLEQVARWRSAQQADVDGQLPACAERGPGALEWYPATIALEPLLADLAGAGLPARLSDDAGSYVCNHTYYAALHTIAAESQPTCCLFLHVPPDPQTFDEPVECPTLPIERQIEAVERILAWLAR